MVRVPNVIRFQMILFAIVVAGCRWGPAPAATGILIDLALPDATYRPGEVFWSVDGSLSVIVLDRNSRTIGETPDDVLYVTLDGSQHYLHFQRLEVCPISPFYYGFTRLPNGRLMLGATCLNADTRQRTLYLYTHDDVNHQTSLLLESPFPDVATNSYAWNADANRALAGYGSLYSGLYWMDNNGPQPVTGTVSAYGRQFSLATAWTQYDQQGVVDTGNATSPAWSGDGGTVAFLASHDSIGRRGMARATGRWSLYFMDAVSLEPELVLQNIYGPGGAVWSADSQFLAFYAQVGARGARGLWIYRRGATSATLAALGSFRGFLWSDDGKYIYAIRYLDDDFRRTELWQYDVSTITQADAP